MRGRRFTILSATSFILCVATCAWWVLSYWLPFGPYHLSHLDSENMQVLHSLESGGGVIDYLYTRQKPLPDRKIVVGWGFETRESLLGKDILRAMKRCGFEIAGFGIMGVGRYEQDLFELSIPCWAVAGVLAGAPIAAFRRRQRRRRVRAAGTTTIW